MRDIGKREHCNLIEFAGRCELWNKKAQSFFGWSRLQSEQPRLARKDGFAPSESQQPGLYVPDSLRVVMSHLCCRERQFVIHHRVAFAMRDYFHSHAKC